MVSPGGEAQLGLKGWLVIDPRDLNHSDPGDLRPIQRTVLTCGWTGVIRLELQHISVRKGYGQLAIWLSLSEVDQSEWKLRWCPGRSQVSNPTAQGCGGA